MIIDIVGERFWRDCWLGEASAMVVENASVPSKAFVEASVLRLRTLEGVVHVFGKGT